jgi:hypothetical protein
METPKENVGRGRRQGQSYTHRTDTEICRDNKDKEGQARNQAKQRREAFFVPATQRTVTLQPNANLPTVTAANTLVPTAVATAAPRNPANPPASREKRMKLPTEDDPLPGVDMHSVPQIFRPLVGKVIMFDLRTKMKSGTKNANQHQQYTYWIRSRPMEEGRI